MLDIFNCKIVYLSTWKSIFLHIGLTKEIKQQICTICIVIFRVWLFFVSCQLLLLFPKISNQTSVAFKLRKTLNWNTMTTFMPLLEVKNRIPLASALFGYYSFVNLATKKRLSSQRRFYWKQYQNSLDMARSHKKTLLTCKGLKRLQHLAEWFMQCTATGVNKQSLHIIFESFHFTNPIRLDTVHLNMPYSDLPFYQQSLVSQTALLTAAPLRLSRSDYLLQAALLVHQHSSCLQSTLLLLGCWFPYSTGVLMGVMQLVCGPNHEQKKIITQLKTFWPQLFKRWRMQIFLSFWETAHLPFP